MYYMQGFERDGFILKVGILGYSLPDLHVLPPPPLPPPPCHLVCMGKAIGEPEDAQHSPILAPWGLPALLLHHRVVYVKSVQYMLHVASNLNPMHVHLCSNKVWVQLGAFEPPKL